MNCRCFLLAAGLGALAASASPLDELQGFMYTTWVENHDNIGIFMRELK